MSNEPLLHIVYLESRMLLSKKRYSDWRQIQDEFADYKTPLGPWTVAEVLDFLGAEYRSDCPFTKEQVQRFLLSNDETTNA
jgi:hypothetical protein